MLKLIFIKYPNVTSNEVLYWRSLIMTVMGYFFIRAQGQDFNGVPRKFHRILVIRCLVGFVGI